MELLLLIFIAVGGWQIFKRILLIMGHLEIEDPVVTEINRQKGKRKAKADAKAAKKAIRKTMKEV